MQNPDFPCLDPNDIYSTRSALHAYSRIPGAWLKSCRPRRKHWWHASLRPSLHGLTSGLLHAGIDFEMEVILDQSLLRIETSTGAAYSEPLYGQPMGKLTQEVGEFLLQSGIDICFSPPKFEIENGEFRDYRTDVAIDMGLALGSVSRALETLQAGIREETSPVQLWPHHFDLSMLWLPGDKVPGQDPGDEEYADKQMNFGFTFGDEMITEPYFYITAYPMPVRFTDYQLPAGSVWHTEGFNGVVLLYRTLLRQSQPLDYLLGLWQGLLAEGRKHLTLNPRRNEI